MARDPPPVPQGRLCDQRRTARLHRARQKDGEEDAPRAARAPRSNVGATRRRSGSCAPLSTSCPSRTKMLSTMRVNLL